MHHRVDVLRILIGVFGVVLFAARPPGVSALAADQADARLVRLSRKDLQRSVRLGIRPDSVADYGAFAWVELSQSELENLRASGVAFQEQANAFTLHLGGESFDPRFRTPIAPPGLGDAAGSGPDFHLIQFNGPIRAAWVDGLKGSGLDVVQYIPPHTFVVWGEMSARDRAARAKAVRWSGPFIPAYRVLPRWRNLAAVSTDVRALLYRGTDVEAAVRSIKALGGELAGRKVITDDFEVVRFSIPGTALGEVSKVRGVYTVQPVPTDGGLRSEMSNQVNVNNVDVDNLAFTGYLSWLTGVGLSGLGVVVAAVDAGIDDAHPDLVNRLILCTGLTCAGSASDRHGTHTAGIIAADGSSGVMDGFGFLRGLGMAPGASLVEQAYSPFFLYPNGAGMLLLMTESYRNGADLSSNSWGPSGVARGYDIDTKMVDVGVRDADPDAPGNQSLTYVLSIMNGFGGVSEQGTPDEAKNVFTIGSTKMRNDTTGQQLLDIDDLSSNTAHGPALDGRTIPHMVAPGCSVDSTGLGGGYFLECGTSMATPHVSGAIALFIEYYRELLAYSQDPSPALIKAAFVAVAKDLAGNRDADNNILGHPFDSKQGWGRMDVEAVLDPIDNVRYFDNPQVLDNTGEEWVVVLSPDDASKPVRLMLAWTDAPGHGLGGTQDAWNNDLDLVVEAGDDVYLGNSFGVDGWSRVGGTADFRNNTEGVFLGPVPPAGFTVRVLASNINSDGIPGEGDNTDQDFALVCYNCLEDPDFTLTAVPQVRDVCSPDDAVYDIEIGQVFGFSEPVTLSASGEPAGTIAGFSDNPVVPPSTSVLTLSNTGAADAGTYQINVSGAATSSVRSRNVKLNLYSDVPGPVTLLSPGQGETHVLVNPLFEWTAATQASTYTIEMATDELFSNVVDTQTGLEGTDYTPEVSLDVGTLYYWRVRAENACGAGSAPVVFSFTTRVVPPILLVDDDDNLPDVRSFYTEALDALLVDYDIWDTNNSDVEPDFATLESYEAVIWFTGAEYEDATGPGPAGETALASYLDQGRRLFISSQDYFWNRGITPFMSGYLGVLSAESDVNQMTVSGAGSVFAGMGPFVFSTFFSNWSDILSPDATAEVAFVGNQGNAAVAKDSGVYRTTFWGFAFELINNADDRLALMAAVLDWCGVITMIDCNGNDIPDYVDIASGASEDCNANVIPDECEPGEFDADFDADCDVDLKDFEMLHSCFTGERGVIDPGCEPTDIDGDGDADMVDFARFQKAFTGQP